MADLADQQNMQNSSYIIIVDGLVILVSVMSLF